MSIDKLSLTPLEILSAPLTNYMRSRRERLLLCPHGSPFINPSPSFFRQNNSNLKIALIHVGKCGGESIMSYLRCALPPNSYSMFEYHCFNANELIRMLLHDAKNDPRIVLVISIRDPLDRWVASFNWDYHNVVLSTTEPIREFVQMIKRFPKVQDLARAIANNDRQACSYGRLSHMGMGASWYIDESLIDSLPTDRTYIIRLDSIKHDLACMVNHIAQQMPHADIEIPKHVPFTKANYKDAYPPNTFGNIDGLNSVEVQQMRSYLKKDYEVHVRLVELATRQGREMIYADTSPLRE